MGIGTSNAKRIPAALLAVLMLLPVTACNKQNDTTVDTSTETTTESTSITYTFGFTDEPEENESTASEETPHVSDENYFGDENYTGDENNNEDEIVQEDNYGNEEEEYY